MASQHVSSIHAQTHQSRLSRLSVILAALSMSSCIAPSAPCAVTQAPAAQNANHRGHLVPVEPQGFLVEPGKDVTLKWTWDGPAFSGDIACQIGGYDGRAVSEANATQRGSTVSLVINLPAGFYAIAFPEQKQVFGLVVGSPIEGQKDAFFGLDASLSWLGPQQLRPSFVSILQKMGVSIARERLKWQEIEPKPGSWDWESPRRYDSVRHLYSGASIPVLEVFHAAPDWMQTDKTNSVFPENLPETKKSWEQIAHHWSKNWGGIEVWNEPDIVAGRGGPQAERYVPLVKTMRYAFQSANAATPIGGGVFAYFTRSYMDLAAENGLLQTVDFLSFHYYKDPFQLEAFVSEYRAYLKQFDREALPLWITESGKNWKGTPHTRPDPEQDRSSALQYAELAVEAKACGVARIFPFVLVDYSEYGTNNFGLLDAAGTPVRSLASYATAIRELSHAKYIGDVDLGEKALRARAFASDDGKAVVVIEAPATDQSSITLPFHIKSVDGVDGRSLAIKDKNIPLADGMSYIHVDLADLQGRLKQDTVAMALQHAASLTLPHPVVAPIVLEASLDSKSFPYGVRGYEIPQGVTRLPVRLRVNNLSNTTQELSVSFMGETSPTSPRLKISSSSSRDIVQNVDVSSIHYDSGGVGRVRVEAQSVAGPILPVVFYVSSPVGLDAYLNAHPYHFALPIGDLDRWEKNTSGNMTFSKSEAGNFQYAATFQGKDHWAYPRFVLPQEVDLDRITGVLVRGRCQQPATVRIMTWAGKSSEYNLTGYSIFPADGQWHVVYVPFADFIPPAGSAKVGRQVKTISVGIGSSREDSNRVEVSDLILLGN